MAGQSLVFSESIDDVLKIVQETPRGRWFIEAYAQRVKGEGTSSILTAISKLENHISSMANSGASAEVLQKARSAIAQARQEIANLEPKTAELSSEAQLFAKLADLSRQAFGENQGGKGVERALKLVADLDRDLNGAPAIENQAAAKPPQQYFKQDEAIFEAAPAPKLVAEKPSVAKVLDTPEVSNKGAKLVIRRLSAVENPAPVPSETAIETPAVAAEEPKFEAPAEAPIAIISAPEPGAEAPAENSRIVIIRRKADETMSVPLVDAEAEVNAA